MQRRFGRFPGRRHDRFLVVKGNGVKDQFIKIGIGGAQQRLGAGSAFRIVQIHHGRSSARGQRPGHRGREPRPHAHGHGHSRTEFQKVTAAHAPLLKAFFRPVPAHADSKPHDVLLNMSRLIRKQGAQCLLIFRRVA